MTRRRGLSREAAMARSIRPASSTTDSPKGASRARGNGFGVIALTHRTVCGIENRSIARAFHDGAPAGHIRPSSLRGSAYAQTVVDPGPGAHGCRPRGGAGGRGGAPPTKPPPPPGGGGGGGGGRGGGPGGGAGEGPAAPATAPAAAGGGGGGAGVLPTGRHPLRG